MCMSISIDIYKQGIPQSCHASSSHKIYEPVKQRQENVITNVYMERSKKHFSMTHTMALKVPVKSSYYNILYIYSRDEVLRASSKQIQTHNAFCLLFFKLAFVICVYISLSVCLFFYVSLPAFLCLSFIQYRLKWVCLCVYICVCVPAYC